MSTDRDILVRGKLRAEFDDILSDDTMTHAEKVEEAIDAAMSVAMAGPGTGGGLTEVERASLESIVTAYDRNDDDFIAYQVGMHITILRRLAARPVVAQTITDDQIDSLRYVVDSDERWGETYGWHMEVLRRLAWPHNPQESGD